jgi:hypothetical protein
MFANGWKAVKKRPEEIVAWRGKGGKENLIKIAADKFRYQ